MKSPFAFSWRRAGVRLSSGPLSREKADTLLLLAACTLVLFPHAGHLPFWVAPVCAGLLLWRGWLTFHGKRMPPRWLLLPIAVAAMVGVFLSYRTFFGREPGIAMLTLLLTLKLLEMRAKRDLFVALFLSFFLILSSFFYSQSIGTALMTIVAVVAILTTQLSFQYTGTVPPLKQRLRLGATILLLAAPVTLVLFLLFPRIQGPLWGIPEDAHTGRTGLSDNMAPGNISKLAQSEEVAFQVKFTGPPPPQTQLYWRGPVLGAFDGVTWTPLRTQSRRPRQIALNLRGAPLHYQVTLEPHGKRWVFALEMPQAVPSLPGNPVGVNHDMQLLASLPLATRLRYDVASHLEYDLQPNETIHILQDWLDLPQGFNPRTLELVTELQSASINEAGYINALLSHFRRQNFRYTLEPPRLGKHSVDEFLFDTRAGFCEHYSQAFVVLMRAAGIPARVVTGYQGGEINPADGYMVIRQSDAHAWAEVWLENRGWVRVDPTAAVAPNRVERNLASVVPRRVLGGLITLDGKENAWTASLHRLRLNWDAVTNAWNQLVLNYTPEQQKNFMKWLGFENPNFRTMTALMITLVILAVAIAVLPLLLHQRKRDPIQAVYETLCRHLERKGYPRAPHEGPRAYATRLTSETSSLPTSQKAALARFLELYETVRYGVTDLSPAAAASRLKSLLAECR